VAVLGELRTQAGALLFGKVTVSFEAVPRLSIRLSIITASPEERLTPLFLPRLAARPALCATIRVLGTQSGACGRPLVDGRDASNVDETALSGRRRRGPQAI